MRSSFFPSAVVGCALALVAACGQSTGSAGTGDGTTGGSIGSGGTSSAGGASGKGGSSGLGGTAGTGGATSTNVAGTGGMSGTGGATGSGGAIRTGGAAGSGGFRAGGAAGTGGIIATGGGSGVRTGGAIGTGGITRTGGTAASGGSATGGNGTGGATAGRDAGPDLPKLDATSPNRGTDATYPPITGKPTVYLAGDSTVQTYSASQAPQQGWGQRIAEFFTTDVVFVNKAIGGRSSKSFIDEGRLTEILNVIKAGDYLFAQWGINDRYQSDATRYTDPATTFRTYLKQYVDGARGRNAFPVLVTPTPRLDYTNGVFQNGFVDYCSAIMAVGLETNTPVIDLQTMGLAYYTSIGYDAVVANVALAGPDVLHFRDTGAYQMARLVAQGVSDVNIPISPFVLHNKLSP